MSQEKINPDVLGKLREVRETQSALGAEQEGKRQAAFREAVTAAADLVEGNKKLQKNIRDERFEKAHREDWVPGFGEAERRQEWDIKALQISIAELEKETIPALESEMSETKRLLGVGEDPGEALADADIELARLKELLTQRNQELAVAVQLAQEQQERHREFTAEQGAIKEDNVGFAVDAVLGQHEKSGEPLELKKEDVLMAVNGELSDRVRRREEEEKRRHDSLVEAGQNQYLEKAKLDLEELRRTVGEEFKKFDELTLDHRGPEWPDFWNPIRERASRIGDLLSKKFIFGKEKKERNAMGSAKVLKKEIETVLDDLRQEMRNVPEECWKFRREHFGLSHVEGKGMDSSRGETVWLGLDEPNYYKNADKQKKMNAKREEVKSSFERFEEHVGREVDKYIAEVNRLAPKYPDKLK